MNTNLFTERRRFAPKLFSAAGMCVLWWLTPESSYKNKGAIGCGSTADAGQACELFVHLCKKMAWTENNRSSEWLLCDQQNMFRKD